VSGPAASAAVLALVANGRRRPFEYSALLDEENAGALLEREHGLLADQLLEPAAQQINSWIEEGIELLTVLDPGYPENLRAIPTRPPLLFVRGQLQRDDARAVAVIGSRRATIPGKSLAREITHELVDAGYAVVSGLAAGIDTAAHDEAIACGGRTVAVIGTGLRQCYPPANADLQRRIVGHGAVISQFWPDTPPRRENFPLRNALMSGISLATVVVEASARSGARIQARLALGQGRRVLLAEPLLKQQWARKLSEQSGACVIGSASEVPALVDRLAAEPRVSQSTWFGR
jgi:DNA processing protein